MSWRIWLQDGVWCFFNERGNFVLISFPDSSFSKVAASQIMRPISIKETIDPGTQLSPPPQWFGGVYSGKCCVALNGN